ncbi:MAG: aminoglycoside phosphotransferase family protein [Clostridia bacterium]|nr:aminoglycoside phosphotransferase family protein [Clostridia bacterium]
MNRDNIQTAEVLAAYFSATPSYCALYGNGHINDTFLVVVGDKRFIMQRMNTSIFTRPVELMANIIGVTEHIRAKARKEGGDVARASLVVVPTLDGKQFFVDSNNYYWRVYEFCEHTVTRERVENANDFYTCGKAFGNFQQMLADYPAEKLSEPIANFHNTPWRYENLMKAVEADKVGRLATVLPEVEFARARKEFCAVLENARANGTLPLRVTHNDTKLNNILFDEVTGEPVCVIDLDTVMPGYSVTDFGDSIRFGANTAAEDETDLSKISLDLNLFRVYAKGFLEGCNGSLTPTEIDLLPEGAIMMTLECGLRFLTDHLEGDVYFRIHRENHNLDRARNQFALVADMEKKLGEMKKIVRELADG